MVDPPWGNVLKTYANIGSFLFFCLLRVNYGSGVEEPELPTPPDDFTVWGFTREELQMVDPDHFFPNHREEFITYDGNEMFSISTNGSRLSHMFYFSSL
ncbi:hypothetical protein Y032_0050g1965 [Ancylostoma ceylanicum]|nr:hypothetical protein Y032_0050g1965 [Ancylostoma ceylanicum]